MKNKFPGSQYVGWRQFNVAVNISLKNRYIFIEMPKVASSSIKLLLSNHEVAGLPVTVKDPHPRFFESTFVKPYNLDEETLNEIFLPSSGFFKFCFVRNPYSRTLSAYLDKIQTLPSHRKQILKALSRGDDPDTAKISFSEFADALMLQQEFQMDKHWRSQYSNALGGAVRLDFVGKLENFEDDIEFVKERLDIGLKTSDFVRRPHETKANEKLLKFYTEKEIKIVKDRFAKDFEVFDYDTSFDF